MTNHIKKSHRRRAPLLALMVATVAFAGCDLDELLSVEDRDVVTPATLEDPDVLPVVVAGALGDFTNAFSGGGGNDDSYVTVSALMADEFFSSGSFPTRTATDRREQQSPANGNTSDFAYNALHQARRALHDAAELLAEIEGTDDPAYSQLKALEGYSVVMLGEGYCSAVPLSSVGDGGAFNESPGLSTTAVLDSAIARFDVALAAEDTELARIGKARALLAQGNAAEAAAVVSGVSTDYVYQVLHSTSGESNDVYAKQNNGRFSQSDVEGENGVAFRSADDPRTPWEEDPLGGFTETIPLYVSLLHTDFGDPLTLASGIEARLIEAEAELQASDYAGVTAILNTLRSTMADDLDDLPDASNEAEAIDQLFTERAYWLFLTGHRLGDLRRMVYQYGMDQDDVYPTGAYHKGATYGDDVVFPIDFDEGNNLEFDPSACDVTSASIN